MAELTGYPREGRDALLDRDMIGDYLACLFGRVFYKPGHFVNVRGIGEKGTDRDGAFQEDCWAQPGLAQPGLDPDQALADAVAQWCANWAHYNIASYIVPAVLKEARGSAQAVELFPAAVVDLDSGDTVAKARFLGQHLGQPTMAVRSGGVTEQGTPKLHLYWVFDDPCEDVKRVVDMRHEIARKAGGDLQFGRGTPDNPYGRAHQPIRIAGSVHAKNDHAQAVRLASCDGPTYDVELLAEAVRRMPESPWRVEVQVSASPSLAFDGFGPMVNHRPDMRDVMREVQEGGEERTRFGEFSRVAGMNIRRARNEPGFTVAEALDDTKGWVLRFMVPPWPEAKVEREFRALLTRDEAKNGTIRASAVEPVGSLVRDEKKGLREWAMHLWTDPRNANTPVPERKFLVDGLVLDGKPQLLVAEGGAGKSFAMLDLCLKVAARETYGDDATWLGQPVSDRGGTVVMLTTEDDADEIYLRVHGIDPDGKRFAAGERLIVVPAINTERGPFAFVERDKATGGAVASPGLREFLGWLGELPDLRLVVVDTLNTTMHGEENSATVANEYARHLAPITKMGAALLVTHHIRKQDPKFPIRSIDDMLGAVRGSSALTAAFRSVVGLWRAPDYGRLLQALGHAPKDRLLWRMGVLKANNPQMVEGVRHLLRQGDGTFADVSGKIAAALGDESAQRRAWMTAAIGAAARGGQPYKHGGKNNERGLYARRSELHPMLRGIGRNKIEALAEELVDRGDVSARMVEWQTARMQWREFLTLDAKGGPYDQAQPPRVELVPWQAPDWSGSWHFDPETGEVLEGRASIGVFAP